MAGILNEFVQNTKILSSKVNENFAIVQDDITELGQALNSNFSTQLVSVKNDLLTDIESISKNKANVKLDNVEPDVSFIQKMADYIAPNYEEKISINSGYTAVESGWVIGFTSGLMYSTYWAAYVNGVNVSHDGGQYNNVGHFTAFVSVGDVVTWSGYNSVIFCPCKGVK